MCSRTTWKVFLWNNFLLEIVDSCWLLWMCQACHNCGWQWGRLVGLQRVCAALPDPLPASWVDDKLKNVISQTGFFKVFIFCKFSQIFDFSYMLMGELSALWLLTEQQFCVLASSRYAAQLSTPFQLQKQSIALWGLLRQKWTLSQSDPIHPFRQNALPECPWTCSCAFLISESPKHA